MDDRDLDIVRENMARLAEGQRDRQLEMQSVFKRDDKLQDAIGLARKVSWFGLIPALIVTLYFEYLAGLGSVAA